MTTANRNVKGKTDFGKLTNFINPESLKIVTDQEEYDKTIYLYRTYQKFDLRSFHYRNHHICLEVLVRNREDDFVVIKKQLHMHKLSFQHVSAPSFAPPLWGWIQVARECAVVAGYTTHALRRTTYYSLLTTYRLPLRNYYFTLITCVGLYLFYSVRLLVC